MIENNPFVPHVDTVPTNAHADSHSQPSPLPGGLSVTNAVVKDLAFRRIQGTSKYGTELLSHNGRDALVDAYQEALDLVMYLKQALLERDNEKR